MKIEYFLPEKGDERLSYSCMLRTNNSGNHLYIPVLTENSSINPTQKQEKFNSYQLISGDTRLTVVTISKNKVTEKEVNNYDDILKDSVPITSKNLTSIRKYFTDTKEASQAKPRKLEDELPITRIEPDAQSSSQALIFHRPPNDPKFLKESVYEITDFTSPFHGLIFDGVLSLEKLEFYINNNPRLKELYNEFKSSPLFQLFTTHQNGITGSRSFDAYINDKGIPPETKKQLLAIKDAFKGVVENVSKIHDKPEVRFVRFIQSLILNMTNTLGHRGFDESSHPIRFLNYLITEFNTVMSIYLNATKDEGGSVSQEKCREIIKNAVKLFEKYLRDVLRCPIHPWVALDFIARTRSSLQKAGIVTNKSYTQVSSNLSEQKIDAADTVTLDAVKGTDVQNLRGRKPIVIGIGNAMFCDGSPLRLIQGNHQLHCS